MYRARQVCEVRDTLAALDRRCASAESALHGAVSHGQVIDAIRSIMGPFREQLNTRLSTLENDTANLNVSLGQASTNTREFSEVRRNLFILRNIQTVSFYERLYPLHRTRHPSTCVLDVEKGTM